MRVTAAPTRERLLLAARSIVEERGYAEASVIRIAERAGVASGTLYRHFASKEELFVELFRAVADGELRAMNEAAASMPAGAGAIDELVEMLLTFAARALRVRHLAWALLAEPVDPLVDRERIVYRARHAELLTSTLERAVAGGEIPAQDVRLTSAALVGGCAEVLLGPLSPIGPAGRDETALLASLAVWIRRSVGAPA